MSFGYILFKPPFTPTKAAVTRIVPLEVLKKS